MKAENPYRVIVMGKTGAGKSSVLNSLIGKDYFKVGDSILSETKEVKTIRGKFKGRHSSPDIVFIDTPGFFDSSSRDNKIIAKIALSLHEINDGINLVLFCFPAYEIRLDSSMQASWRFLKLIMGKAVYDHVMIVLTHGSRLEPQELENAVARMTTEFIPYLQNKLKCKVRNEILVYKKGYEDDGLDDVLNCIISSKKYKPEVMNDISEYWNPQDPLRSIENLLKNSETFGRIQDLLTELYSKNQSIQGQMKLIKQEMKTLTQEKEKKTRRELDKFASNLNEKLKAEQVTVQTLRNEVTNRMQLMQQQMEEKNKQIDILWKELNELKTMPKLHDSLTTRATEKTTLETERSPDNKSKLSSEEEITYAKCSYRKPLDYCFKTSPYARNDKGVIVMKPVEDKFGCCIVSRGNTEINTEVRSNVKVLDNPSTKKHNGGGFGEGFDEKRNIMVSRGERIKQGSNEKYYTNPACVVRGIKTPYNFDIRKSSEGSKDVYKGKKTVQTQLGNPINTIKKPEGTQPSLRKHSVKGCEVPHYRPKYEAIRNYYILK